jgi:uncharacterized protein YjbJ (UPF0337 family)
MRLTHDKKKILFNTTHQIIIVRTKMLKYITEGNLMILKGKFKLMIGKLIKNHFSIISGEKDLMLGKIQQQYRLSLNEAKIVSRWNVPIQ